MKITQKMRNRSAAREAIVARLDEATMAKIRNSAEYYRHPLDLATMMVVAIEAAGLEIRKAPRKAREATG